MPGLAKTLLVSLAGQALDLSFGRIQFTPDLMPADITGTDVLRRTTPRGKRAFQFQPGPMFANLVLADEINRTPPKTQAALLEAMQERQVTVGGGHATLCPSPFFVLATQNPIEQEGTYPLPEAQLDRFLLEIHVGYPSEIEEREVARRTTSGKPVNIEPVLHIDEVRDVGRLVPRVPDHRRGRQPGGEPGPRHPPRRGPHHRRPRVRALRRRPPRQPGPRDGRQGPRRPPRRGRRRRRRRARPHRPRAPPPHRPLVPRRGHGVKDVDVPRGGKVGARMRTALARACCAAACGASALLALLACRPAPTCGPADGGCDAEATLVHDGIPRTYRYHLPKRRSPSPGAPTPSAPSCWRSTGGGGTGKGMISITHFGPLADEEGFVVAYPDGFRMGWNDGREETPAGRRDEDDVGFVSALINHLVATYAVDPARVYVTGISNGGMMSLRLACDLAGKITAVAPSPASTPRRSPPPAPASPRARSRCSSSPAPPTRSSPTPAAGSWRPRPRPLRARHLRPLGDDDGCTPEVTTTEVPHTLAEDRTRTRRMEHASCAGGSKVVLYSVEGGGHTWPGGKQYLPEAVIGYTARELDASRVMWKFFEGVGARKP